MKRFLLFIVSAQLSFASSAMATEVVWWRLTTLLNYRDLSVICSTSLSGKDLYLSAEIQGGKVLRANLRTGTTSFAKHTALTANEAASIQLFENKGRLWLKQLPLSGVSTAWILMNLGGEMGCQPSLPIASITPNLSWQFDLSGIESLPAVSPSTQVKMSGALKDGSGFSADIYFTQTPK